MGYRFQFTECPNLYKLFLKESCKVGVATQLSRLSDQVPVTRKQECYQLMNTSRNQWQVCHLTLSPRAASILQFGVSRYFSHSRNTE